MVPTGLSIPRKFLFLVYSHLYHEHLRITRLNIMYYLNTVMHTSSERKMKIAKVMNFFFLPQSLLSCLKR